LEDFMSRLFAVLVVLAFSSCRSEEKPVTPAPAAEAKPAADSDGRETRAEIGNDVLVVLTYVKGDQREPFEKFVAFMGDTMDKIGATDAEFARKTGTFRMLSPQKPNEDGTLTYAFVGDPLYEGTETGLEPILSRVHSKEEIAELVKPWDAAMAKPQEGFDFVQTKLINPDSEHQAMKGEEVVMFFTYVRPEKRAEFEGFIEFFNGAMATLGAGDADFARKSGTFRALYAPKPMEDGSLLYVFMGDPLLEGTETGIQPILARLYSQEEIDKHVKPWDEAVIRQETYQFVQSEF
jgi:hypothetical protein